MRYELPSLLSFAVLLVTSAVVVAGCGNDLSTEDRRGRSGDGTDGNGASGGDGPNCSTTYAGRSSSRRLTRFEYENTVLDLLGDASSPASSFPAEEVFYGFDNNATERGVSLSSLRLSTWTRPNSSPPRRTSQSSFPAIRASPMLRNAQDSSFRRSGNAPIADRSTPPKSIRSSPRSKRDRRHSEVEN
ncbi:hypothetical protein AKJ09_07910 [Labilithrix luteola]|uniref:DUF1587 domain-containing protein n=1 Tax=Labilithrix luteola TaxID=1391654 RepID=A0A0K1Q6H9_9BACT|nr:hypothetical protein AKJ09_07910 [Labilithrix luteola]